MTISPLLEQDKDWNEDWGQNWDSREIEWGESCSLGASDDLFLFQSMRESFTHFTHFSLLFLVVGISAVFPVGASAKGIDPVHPSHNTATVAPVNTATVAPVDPVIDRLATAFSNIEVASTFSNIDELTSTFSLVSRALTGLLSYGNSSTIQPVRSVPPIDWSISYEEKWKGDLTWENLTSQRKESMVLKDQGNRLQDELFRLNPTHDLLNNETRITLGGYRVRKTIRDNKIRYFNLQAASSEYRGFRGIDDPYPDPVGYHVNGDILEEFHNWRDCAASLSTAIGELRRS